MSQDKVTTTLCTEELVLWTQYIHMYRALFTYQTGQMGGKIQRVNAIHLAVPAGFHFF
jgi:hypothetical protein